MGTESKSKKRSSKEDKLEKKHKKRFDSEEKAHKAEKKAKRRAQAAEKNGLTETENEKTEPENEKTKPQKTQPQGSNSFFKQHSIEIERPDSVAELDPVMAMSDLKVTKQLQAVLSAYTKPTPIQAAAWPYLLAGKDVVGVAETGSGKTLAFGVPAVEDIATKNLKGVSVLVVSPTRELAMQIYDNVESLAKAVGAAATCVYGGVPREQQQRDVKRAQIVVGTPGRLKDLIGDGSLVLTKVKYLVLDEADRMLEKGFEQDIKEIISSTPRENRQTVMFTATWPPQVRDLAASFMNSEVVKVSVGNVDELSANKRIEQIVEVVAVMDKERRFLDILRKYNSKFRNQKILVFALYKKEASRVERLLQRQGYKVAAIHGDLNQSQRTQALSDFKSGKCNLMLATDVAARGLDIPAVKVVINLTFPLTAEDYVHRIGRTGRAGNSGLAHTLFTEQEKHLSGALINVLRGAEQPVPDELLKFGSHTKKKEHSLYGAFFKEVDPTQKAKKIKFD